MSCAKSLPSAEHATRAHKNKRFVVVFATTLSKRRVHWLALPRKNCVTDPYNSISTSLSPLASHSTSRSRRFPSQSS